ncbi:MAG: type I-C CRISPR-associated endonuclease Cas1c [Eubacteriales bacterium]|nr:type I-C CRISPR-associated endonuclease Cas1c [Eubacteriales bacterium]
MRKLLNTLYITNEQAYLALDGENVVCKVGNEIKINLPFDNVENIVCFGYLGCSPALMGKCVSKQIPINFLSPNGKFLAKVCGETKGNVFLRVAQIDKFRECSLILAKNTIATKINNSIKLIKRTLHDNSDLKEDEDITQKVIMLKNAIDKIFLQENIESVLGIEGNAAKDYFSIFGKMFTNKSVDLKFSYRSKRPPLDEINATLSFVYTLLTLEYASALETVGLDSSIGFYHTLRSGRNSLACDLVEETRCIVERFVISLVNLKIITKKDFDIQISSACWLNSEGRKKVLTKWQEKKREIVMHPFLKEKIPYGMIPYVQSNLLAKYIRGDLDEYPCYGI